MRVRLTYGAGLPAAQAVSIHALVRVRRTYDPEEINQYLVSIHALVRVRLELIAALAEATGFNPRTRESATSSPGRVNGKSWFQSTHS